MKKYLIIILIFYSSFVDGQIITTIGGGGAFIGDEVPATSTKISNPRGAAFDKFGNFYFTDGVDERVRKIDSNGIISTVAGDGIGGYAGDGGPATAAKLSHPVAIALDTFGNLYIADIGNFCIRKVDIATGYIYTIAGTGSSGFGGDGGPATAAFLGGPDDICFDKRGNLYISDQYRVRKINALGLISTFAGIGTAGSSGDRGAATAAQINGPSGIAADNSGNIYIAERTGNFIRKVDINGIITTFAGNGFATYTGDGKPATNAQIVPLKIGFNISQDLYVTDDYNQRIYKIDVLGIIHLVAGNGIGGFSGDNGPAISAELQLPAGIAFDVCGNLYFPDAYNYRIRKVALNPDCMPECVHNISTIQTINIYPNPANNMLHIDNIKVYASYNVLSIEGKVMQQGALKEGSNSVLMQSIPKGMYILEITNSEQQRTITKIVKQ